jgi:hypothetical protein
LLEDSRCSDLIEFNEAHQHLIYAADVNYLGEDVNSVKKTAEIVLGPRCLNNIGLKESIEKNLDSDHGS